MLKRERRISREDLKSLDKPVFFVNNGILSVRVFINKNINQKSKFSFSVSKKVEKTAVGRNKLRRTGYDSIGIYLDKIKSGFYVRFMFNSKPKIKEDVIKNVLDILKKVNLI